MTNLLKTISNAFFGPGGLIGPPRLSTDTSRGRQYSRLRYGALTIKRNEVGIPTPSSDNPVWGVIIESGYPKHAYTVTVFALNDGTTSVYESGGGGTIGGHGYRSVREANAEAIRLANSHRHQLKPCNSFPIPDAGYTVIYALTDSGILTGRGTSEEFAKDQHELSPLFHAAEEIVEQLHLASQGLLQKDA